MANNNMQHVRIAVHHDWIERETAKAIQINFNGTYRFWLPKSQLHFQVGDSMDRIGIIMPMWLACERGFWGNTPAQRRYGELVGQPGDLPGVTRALPQERTV